jgi:hypothetical protein
MAVIIDKRAFGKNRSAVNRQRFIQRYKKQLKKAVTKAIEKRSITDMNKGEKVNLPAHDLSEPSFQHSNDSGIQERIYPGNKEFMTGDKIKRPPKSAADRGNNASNIGEGLDEFMFELSREEFLNLFFDDFELPDLVKTQLTEVNVEKSVRSGYTKTGVPANINIIRSLKGALSRKIALSGSHKKRITELEKELKNLSPNDVKCKKIHDEIALHEQRMKRIPFIDDFDIRYNNRIIQEQPNTQAVMFCIMDVSGSMDEAKKDIAKRFFILLYLFLEKNYESIQLVFIRHHTSAKEVNEQEFFYSRETGGTVVSSALELMKDIIEKRFPVDDWNIYVAQASDGDNWNADSPYCRDIILNSIIQKVQYYAYIEIMPRHHQSLWDAYKDIQTQHQQFAMKSIHTIQEIYPVLHDLFKRQHA